MKYTKENKEVRSLEEAEQVILTVEEYKKLTSGCLSGGLTAISERELNSYRKALQIYKQNKGKVYGSNGKYKLLSQRPFNYNSDRISFLGVRTEFSSPYSNKELNYEEAKNLILLDFREGPGLAIEICDGVKGREKISIAAYQAYLWALKGEPEIFNLCVSSNGRSGFFEVVLESAGWIPAGTILEELNSL